MDDWDALGRGTVVGHLLECAGQVTGGYFADPGYKDVAGLARLGFPIAEVERGRQRRHHQGRRAPAAGSRWRPARSNCSTRSTIPRRYLPPDVVADFSEVTMSEAGPDRVRVERRPGRARDRQPQGLGRLHRLAMSAKARSPTPGPARWRGGGWRWRSCASGSRSRASRTTETRFDLIGVDALHGERLSAGTSSRTRCACASPGARTALAEAVRIGERGRDALHERPGGRWRGDEVRPRGRGGRVGAAPARPGRRRRFTIWRPDHEAARDRPLPHRRQGQHVQHLRDRLRRSGTIRCWSGTSRPSA